MRDGRLRALAARLTVMLLAVVTVLCLGAGPALARDRVDETQAGSLSVTYADEGVGVAGASVELRRVASVHDFASFSLLDAYADYGLDFEPENSEGWRALAQTIAGYVARDGIEPDASAVTGEDGTVSFANLELGLYLVTSDEVEHEGVIYTQEPALVSVPMENDADAWVYDATSVLKFEKRVAPQEEAVSVSAVKLWVGDDEKTRPLSVGVQLLDDGEVIDEQILSSENGWTHTWDGLDAAGSWSVVESEVPEGYTGTVRREGDAFVVENRAKRSSTEVPGGGSPEPGSTIPDTSGTVPSTGEPAVPLAVVAAIGGTMIVASLWGRLRRTGSDR